MATKFAKGQAVPEGPVQALRMDEDGNFFYMIEWTDADGNVTQRWFEEAQLEQA
jgi:hypothetical protein